MYKLTYKDHDNKITIDVESIFKNKDYYLIIQPNNINECLFHYIYNIQKAKDDIPNTIFADVLKPEYFIDNYIYGNGFGSYDDNYNKIKDAKEGEIVSGYRRTKYYRLTDSEIKDFLKTEYVYIKRRNKKEEAIMCMIHANKKKIKLK